MGKREPRRSAVRSAAAICALTVTAEAQVVYSSFLDPIAPVAGSDLPEIAAEIVGTDRSVLAPDGTGSFSRRSVADAAGVSDYRLAALWLVLHCAGLPALGAAHPAEAAAGTPLAERGFSETNANPSIQARPELASASVKTGLGTVTAGVSTDAGFPPAALAGTEPAACGSPPVFCLPGRPNALQSLAFTPAMAGTSGAAPSPPGTPVALGPPPDTWLAYYPFTGNSANSTDTEPLSTASALTNVGLGAPAYNTPGSPAPSLELAAGDVPGALDATRYLSFTVTAGPGHLLNLTTLSFDLARVFKGNYSVSYALRTSVDSFSADVLSGTITTGSGVFGSVIADLSGPAYDGRTSVTFRLYFWDSNNGANNSILLDNLTLVGAVTVPEPAEYTGLAAVGLLGWLTYRRWNAVQRS